MPVKTPECGRVSVSVSVDVAAAGGADADLHRVALVADVVVGVGDADVELLAEVDRLVGDHVGRVEQFEPGVGQQADGRLDHLAAGRP